MKFALAKEHHDFFDKHGFIEFEDLISPASAQRLAKAVRRQLGQRIGQLPENLSFVPVMQLFEHGRDLWRVNPEIKKQVLNQNLAGIASQLVRQRSLRLGLDQWIPPGMDIKNNSSIEQLIPIQGVLAAAFIALETTHPVDETKPFFPTTAGNALFVNPSAELPFEELSSQHKQSLLLVIYSSKNSVYIYNKSDPLTHYLKEAHYVYGDRLSDSTHPLFLQ